MSNRQREPLEAILSLFLLLYFFIGGPQAMMADNFHFLMAQANPFFKLALDLVWLDLFVFSCLLYVPVVYLFYSEHYYYVAKWGTSLGKTFAIHWFFGFVGVVLLTVIYVQ